MRAAGLIASPLHWRIKTHRLTSKCDLRIDAHCERAHNPKAMSAPREYRFRIDAFSVENIPMSRLAEYMAGLARLLGEQDQVHFKGLEPGSAILVSKVEEPAVRKVGERLQRVREGRASKDALDAFKSLDNLLAKDNAVGTLIPPEGAAIIAFPGRTRPKPMQYGPFREQGSIDGVVIRLGGRDETIPVLIRNGEIEYPCQASVAIAKRLAKHYLGAKLRVHGSGKWVRDEGKTWTLQRFDITDFEVLDDAPLGEMIGRLHAIEGGSWDSTSLADLFDLRREPGDQH